MTRIPPVPSSAPVTSEPAGLSVSPLTEEDAIAEFAVARIWLPELEVDQWQAFLKAWRQAPGSRGIFTVRNQRGAVLGFVTWWRQPDLAFGELLWAGPFVVREMGVRPLVRERLMSELTDLADVLGTPLRICEAL